LTQAADESNSDSGAKARRWLTLANAITALRLPLAPLCAFAILEGGSVAAFFYFWAAVGSDLIDGRVARRRGEVTRLGGVLDHTSDAFFVAAGLAAQAALGIVPWPLAPLVVLAFVQYAADSRVLAGRILRTSQLGRLNGIAYYVLLGVPIVREAAGWGWPGDALVSGLGWLLVVSTLVSMGDRALTWRLTRRVRDSPGAGR